MRHARPMSEAMRTYSAIVAAPSSAQNFRPASIILAKGGPAGCGITGRRPLEGLGRGRRRKALRLRAGKPPARTGVDQLVPAIELETLPNLPLIALPSWPTTTTR